MSQRHNRRPPENLESSEALITSTGTSRCADNCVTVMSSVFLALSILILVFTAGSSYPLHASCRTQLTFTANCGTINQAIVDQIHRWEGASNCGTGQKCLYALDSHTDAKITGTHTTPVKHYVDDISFTFVQNGNTCNVEGFSTSQTWYAYLDYGTNYCNLHNLVDGAGLTTSAGYSETTSNSVCTQYTYRNCEVY